MSHTYDDMILNVSNNYGVGAVDYWRLDRDTDELNNLSDVLLSPLSAANVTSGSTPASILPGSNNLYADYFDGSTAYVTATTNKYTPMFDTAWQAGSIECWLKADTVDTGVDVVGIMVKSGCWGIYLDYGKLAFFTQPSGGSRRNTIASSAISTGTVYHVVGTYDPNTGDQILYVNGSQAAITSSLSGAAYNNAINLTIGAWDTSTLFFNGRISNPALYSAALSSTIVGDHANYS